MIGYTTLGSNDIPKAAAFYDELLAELGMKRIWDEEDLISWGVSASSPTFGVIKPFNGDAATVGNGTMIALATGSPEQVDQFHAKALALGATDEGAPGYRLENFYGAYFRDLDGNKLAIFYMTDAG